MGELTPTIHKYYYLIHYIVKILNITYVTFCDEEKQIRVKDLYDEYINKDEFRAIAGVKDLSDFRFILPTDVKIINK